MGIRRFRWDDTVLGSGTGIEGLEGSRRGGAGRGNLAARGAPRYRQDLVPSGRAAAEAGLEPWLRGGRAGEGTGLWRSPTALRALPGARRESAARCSRARPPLRLRVDPTAERAVAQVTVRAVARPYWSPRTCGQGYSAGGRGRRAMGGRTIVEIRRYLRRRSKAAHRHLGRGAGRGAGDEAAVLERIAATRKGAPVLSPLGQGGWRTSSQTFGPDALRVPAPCLARRGPPSPRALLSLFR